MTAPVQGSRLALVIGNNDYIYSQSLKPLNCPVNDAEDMATVLRELGFTVIDEYNLKHQDFEQVVQSFEDQLHKERASNNFVNFKTRPARLKQNLAGQEQRPNLILTWQVFF